MKVSLKNSHANLFSPDRWLKLNINVCNEFWAYDNISVTTGEQIIWKDIIKWLLSSDNCFQQYCSPATCRFSNSNTSYIWRGIFQRQKDCKGPQINSTERGEAVFMCLLGSWRFPTFILCIRDGKSRNCSVAVLWWAHFSHSVFGGVELLPTCLSQYYS